MSLVSARYFAWFSLVVSGLVFQGCKEKDDDAHDTPPTLPNCDVALAECQRSIFRQVARLRGENAGELPQIRTVTPAALEPELRAEFGAAVEVTDRKWDEALALLGLATAEESVVEVYIQQYLNDVAAFYDTDKKRITIIDRDGASESAAYVLAHEFVHALQDRANDLNAQQERWVKSSDNRLALDCLIEGEATVLSTVLFGRQEGIEPRDLHWSAFAESLLGDAEAAAGKSLAPIYSVLETTPYGYGTRYLFDSYLRRGQPAISDLYEALPPHAVEWTRKTPFESPIESETIDCHPTVAPAGYQVFDHDSFGPASILAFGAGSAASAGWDEIEGSVRGDEVVIFTEQGVEPEESDVLVHWRLRTRDSATARAVASIIESVIAPYAEVRLNGTDVLLRASSDTSLISALAECGPANPPLARPLSNAQAAARRHGHFVR